MPSGLDVGRGSEPGTPRIIQMTSPKADAITAAREAGLTVLEGQYQVTKIDAATGKVYEVVTLPPNLFLTAGVEKILRLITGETSTHFDVAAARLAVGNSDAEAVATQTDLQGANKLRKVVSAPPVVSGNQVTFAAEFSTGDANWQWLEVGVGNDAAGALWSRSAIESPGLGEKVSTAVWILNWVLSID